MGYFDFLANLGGQDQEGPPPDFEKPVRVPKGAKTRRGGEDFWRAGEEWAAESDEIKPDDSIPMAQEGVDYDVTKHKVKTAHADIQSAYGEALKVLKARPVVNVPGEVSPGPLTMQDATDLQRVLSFVERRGTKDTGGWDKPLQLSDDLRTIASRNTIPPEYAKQLFGAADKLTKAAKAQADLEAMRQPGNALAVTPNEVEARKQRIAQEIQKQGENLKTAGSMRSPQIMAELKKLKDEEARINDILKPPPAEPVVPPTAETETTTKQYDAVFNGSNFSREDRVKAMLDIIEEMGLDIDKPADFKTGLFQVLQTQFPEEIPSFIMYAMGLQPKPVEAQPAPDQEQPRGPHGEGPQVGGPAPDPQELKKRELKDLQMQLAEAQELQSWPAIIAFALLSIIIKPQNAFRFFSNARQKQELQFLIQGVKDDITQLRDEKERKDREQKEYRKMFVERALSARQQDHTKDLDFRRRVMIQAFQASQAMKRAKLRGGDKDPILQKLQKDLENARGMASAAGWDDAARAKWMGIAEGIIVDMDRRSKQLEEEKAVPQE